MTVKKLVTKQEERRARAIVQRAMNQANEQEAAEKHKLIGRCFKYENRYSDGQSWWLYAVVTRVDDLRVMTLQFEHTSIDAFSLSADVYGGLLPSGNWREISATEFQAALVAFAGDLWRTLASALPPSAPSQTGAK